MIYKEFKEIYKQVLIILSFLILIPVLHYTKSSLTLAISESSIAYFGNVKVLYFFLFSIIIFILSGILGISLFSREFKDNSFEYLFSTPMKKWEILLNKIIPRLIIISSLILLYIIFYNVFLNETQNFKDAVYVLILPQFIPFLAIFYFFINISTSIFKQKNWIALMNLLTIYTIIFVSYAIKNIIGSFYMKIESDATLFGYSLVISLAIILFIMGLGFIISYKKLDIRDKHFAGNGFAKIIISIEMILLVSSIFILLK